jgi:pimeloyl-ACP methyl ester carboxylesterase
MNLQENIHRIRQIMGLIFENEEIDPQNLKKKLYKLSGGDGEKTIILIPGSGDEGGQGDADFTSLSEKLGSKFSVYTVNFPNKLKVRDYVKELAHEIKNNDNITSFSVGGFSIGGAFAWHLAKELTEMKVDKFDKKLFFIDSGIPDSTVEFAKGILKGNTPRIAMAYPMDLYEKGRKGLKLTNSEERLLKAFRGDETEIENFKKENENNYLEFRGEGNYPPDFPTLKIEATKMNSTNPWIIVDKLEKDNFEQIYDDLVKIGAGEVAGQPYITADPIIYQKFVENDTLKKEGLGRETESGEILPKLPDVKVFSLVAGKKYGKEKSEQEKELAINDAKKASELGADIIFIKDSEHHNITKSNELVKVLEQLL